MDEYRFVGSHPDELDGGRPLAPGEFTGPIEIIDDPEHEDHTPKNAHLLADGYLIQVPSGSFKAAQKAAAAEAPPEPGDDGLLHGDALRRRGAELDIEGRSSMSADQLREAIAQAELPPAEGNDGNQEG